MQLRKEQYAAVTINQHITAEAIIVQLVRPLQQWT